MKLCAYIRWRGFYGARWDTREQMVADLSGAGAPYSCLRTCQPFGPDDDGVMPERCQPGRTCFAQSPREPGSVVA
ncbi:MAG: hypothetical protein ABMA64_39085 [Myxococcota bacterium]